MKKICLMSGILAGLMCLCTTDGYAEKDTQPHTVLQSCPDGCQGREETVNIRDADGYRIRTSTRIRCYRTGKDGSSEFPCGNAEETYNSNRDQTIYENEGKAIIRTRSATTSQVPTKVVYKEIYFNDQSNLIEE